MNKDGNIEHGAKLAGGAEEGPRGCDATRRDRAAPPTGEDTERMDPGRSLRPLHVDPGTRTRTHTHTPLEIHGAATTFFKGKMWVFGGSTGDDTKDHTITDKVPIYVKNVQLFRQIA